MEGISMDLGTIMVYDREKCTWKGKKIERVRLLLPMRTFFILKQGLTSINYVRLEMVEQCQHISCPLAFSSWTTQLSRPKNGKKELLWVFFTIGRETSLNLTSGLNYVEVILFTSAQRNNTTWAKIAMGAEQASAISFESSARIFCLVWKWNKSETYLRELQQKPSLNSPTYLEEIFSMRQKSRRLPSVYIFFLLKYVSK